MSSNFLINEYPLMLPPSLAAAIGLNEALILQQMHCWLVHGKHKKYEYDTYWIDPSYKQLQSKFPFWPQSTLETIIKSLEQRSILIRSSPSTSKYNCYTINYKALDVIIARTKRHNQDTSNQTKVNQMT